MPNGGNVEYLKDRENCLLYDAGNIEKAKLLLQELQENRVLQENGQKTAQERKWENIENNILSMYRVN